MEYLRTKIIKLLINYFGDDDNRIEHALRVLYHSENIMQKYDEYDQDIVITCALLHDIGIKISEEKFGYNDGKTQEEFGPDVAEQLLSSINFPDDKIEKVKEIIGNHHSKSRYDYIELVILKEADKIVNSGE
ncbi:HD domain-containing protein [bacterium]|nr:HD domain-containing protein [bacterium]